MSEAFDSYKLYSAIRQHFTTPSYDFIKFKGKSYADKHAKIFDKKKDRFFYHKLWDKYKSELKDFYISVCVGELPIAKFAGDLLSDKYHTQYNEWLKTNQSITKSFKNDAQVIGDYLDERGMSFKDIITCNEGELPDLIRLYKNGYIKLETVVVINRLTNFVDRCQTTHPSWCNMKLLITKYQSFVRVSKIGNLASILRTELDKLG